MTTIRNRTSTAVESLLEYIRTNIDTYSGAINTDLASEGRGYRIPTGLTDDDIDRAPQGAQRRGRTPRILAETGRTKLVALGAQNIGNRTIPVTLFVYLSVGDISMTTDGNAHSDEAKLNSAMDDYLEALHRCIQAGVSTFHSEAGVVNLDFQLGLETERRLYDVKGGQVTALQGRCLVTLIQRAQMVVA